MTRTIKVCIHVALVFGAFLVAYQLRRGLPFEWWISAGEATNILIWGLIYAGIAALVELTLRTERASWRFLSARDAVELLRSTAITALVFLLLIFLTERVITLPRSTLILSWLISFFFLVGARLVWRMLHDRSLAPTRSRWPRASNPLLLLGDLASADSYVRRLETEANSPFFPAAIFTTEASDIGLRVRGIPVLGVDDETIERLASEWPTKPALLFLMDPSKHKGLSNEDIGRLKAAGYRLLRQPSLREIGGKDAAPSVLRDIPLEEFLSRAPVSMDSSPVRNLVEGRRVLVTGAGGSIGSELSRQLVAFGCSHITLIDHSEFLLFQIDRELSQSMSASTKSAVICSIRDEVRLNSIFEDEKPEIVFHAAALKHVTLVELNPCEGVLTNIVGTKNVRDAAWRCGARQMVLISTDKAVAPTNVMGSTKRIAEETLSAFEGTMKICAVRFGNVLGSAGSVVPIFQDQIEAGGPVTVTHPDVERYFMTIPEAVQLVLQAAAIHADRSDVGIAKYILEMGAPVKIVDLAKQMIEMSGLTPDVDIEIQFTGLKPGEKMTEVLVDDDEMASFCQAGIMEVRPKPQSKKFSPETIDELVSLARSAEPAQIAQFIRSMMTHDYEVASSLVTLNDRAVAGEVEDRKAGVQS